jgi:leucyl/phenylalanyl-tRNA--protein transferase
MQSTLTPDVLYAAYSQGYFPMPDETGEILWFRPDPRAIIPLDGFHVSRSLRRIINRNTFSITYNQAFSEVMARCAKRQTTWINEEMRDSYESLHAVGHACSLEVWSGDELVGGVYGVHFGSVFFAESMFHRQANASKVALYHLVTHLRQRGFALLECQFMTTHLKSLGAIEIPEEEYMERLGSGMQKEAYF